MTLREKLTRGLVRAMAAHSPLSALLVEEAGFDAVWASGFELSALLGLADMSLVSATQHLDMVRLMADRCSLPIIADIDTGYGNAINVMHTVRLYERAGASAVVIEDKTFPKTTSLRVGGRQQLVPVAEFEGKIRAALDARRSDGMLVVGRTEALIAGLGEEEALARGRAYADAGADLVLVHSKRTDPAEIESFVRRWDRETRLAIVPTSYPQLTEARIRELGRVGLVIYGNHAIRASIMGMRTAFRDIAARGNAAGAESRLASLADVFALQSMREIEDAEARYLQ